METKSRARIVFDVEQEERAILQEMADAECVRRPNTMARILFRRNIEAWKAQREGQKNG